MKGIDTGVDYIDSSLAHGLAARLFRDASERSTSAHPKHFIQKLHKQAVKVTKGVPKKKRAKVAHALIKTLANRGDAVCSYWNGDTAEELLVFVLDLVPEQVEIDYYWFDFNSRQFGCHTLSSLKFKDRHAFARVIQRENLTSKEDFYTLIQCIADAINHAATTDEYQQLIKEDYDGYVHLQTQTGGMWRGVLKQDDTGSPYLLIHTYIKEEQLAAHNFEKVLLLSE